MSYNYPPNNPNDPNRAPGPIDLGDVKAPDFRRRFSPPESRERDYDDPPRREPSRGSNDGDKGYGEEQSGCLNIGGISLNWQMVIFVVVLIVAGLRGGRDTRGCLPSRQCLNGIFAMLAGAVLFVVGAYYAAQGGDATLALAATCGGAVICLGGGGGMLFLLLGIMRAIDLTPDNLADEGGIGSAIDNFFGGRR